MTENKTAGSTPWRKLDFEDTPEKPNHIISKRKTEDDEQGIVIRKKPAQSTIMSMHAKTHTNYFWLSKLADGWCMTYAAYGKPTGRRGFLDKAYAITQEELATGYIEEESLASKMILKAVLPTRCPETLEEREYTWNDGKGKGKYFVFVNNEVNINMTPEEWCRKQMNVLSHRFPSIRALTYGGDALKVKDGPRYQSLDSVFMPEDVANLAFSLYAHAITDGSFFKDKKLMDMYFLRTNDVIKIFKRVGLI